MWCGSDELMSDAAHLPALMERTLLIERADTELEVTSGLTDALSASCKESIQELLVRQAVQLGTDDLLPQVC